MAKESRITVDESGEQNNAGNPANHLARPLNLDGDFIFPDISFRDLTSFVKLVGRFKNDEGDPLDSFSKVAKFLFNTDNRFKAMRWLEGMEKQTEGTTLIDRKGRRGLKGVTSAGQHFYEYAKEILIKAEQCRDLVRQPAQKELRVYASESVHTYILPHLLNNLTAQKIALQISQFDPERFSNEGMTRLAIVWTGYKAVENWLKEQQRNKPQFVEFSSTPVHLIFHSNHPFGRWARIHREPIGVEYANEFLRAMQPFPLFHANTDQLRNIATSLKTKNRLQVEGFSAVAHLVKMQLGLGLFLGWPWLLDDLRRTMHIDSMKFPEVNRLTDEHLTMKLVVIGGSPSERSDAEKAFIGEITEKLRLLSVDRENVWTEVEWGTPFLDGDRFRARWFFHSATSGKHVDKNFFPHWIGGALTIEARGRRKTKGKHTLNGKVESPIEFSVQITFGNKHTLINGHVPASNKNPQSYHVVVSLSRRLKKAGTTAIFLLGFMSYDLMRPTVAPFLLCSENLGMPDKEELQELGKLMDFLANVEGQAVRPDEWDGK